MFYYSRSRFVRSSATGFSIAMTIVLAAGLVGRLFTGHLRDYFTAFFQPVHAHGYHFVSRHQA